jgi:DNA-binding response OmpR family regulator
VVGHTIVVLSAREREAEKIEALDLGADDFINKPFGVGELMARLRAALRHRAQERARRRCSRSARSRSIRCAIA